MMEGEVLLKKAAIPNEEKYMMRSLTACQNLLDRMRVTNLRMKELSHGSNNNNVPAVIVGGILNTFCHLERKVKSPASKKPDDRGMIIHVKS